MVILSDYTARVRSFLRAEIAEAICAAERQTVKIVGLQISAIDGIVNLALHAKEFDASRPPVIPEYTHSSIGVLAIDEWDAEYWSGSPEVKTPDDAIHNISEGDFPYCREFVRWGAMILNDLSMEDSWPFPSAFLAAEGVGMEPVLFWESGKFPETR